MTGLYLDDHVKKGGGIVEKRDFHIFHINFIIYEDFV